MNRVNNAWARWLGKWRQRAKQLKTETYAIYLAYRDPRVPWHARIFAACVVGYAFSPIDLIPDFIPVLGYIDDLVLVPVGIVLALKLIPAAVMVECRVKAKNAMDEGQPVNRGAAVVVIATWLLLAAVVVLLAVRIVR